MRPILVPAVCELINPRSWTDSLFVVGDDSFKKVAEAFVGARIVLAGDLKQEPFERVEAAQLVSGDGICQACAEHDELVLAIGLGCAACAADSAEQTANLAAGAGIHIADAADHGVGLVVEVEAVGQQFFDVDVDGEVGPAKGTAMVARAWPDISTAAAVVAALAATFAPFGTAFTPLTGLGLVAFVLALTASRRSPVLGRSLFSGRGGRSPRGLPSPSLRGGRVLWVAWFRPKRARHPQVQSRLPPQRKRVRRRVRALGPGRRLALARIRPRERSRCSRRGARLKLSQQVSVRFRIRSSRYLGWAVPALGWIGSNLHAHVSTDRRAHCRATRPEGLSRSCA